MFDEYFAKANELTRQGVPFVTATVVRAEKPTSGKPGDKAIITVDGVMHGWIGGSCAQPAVIAEALRALAADESHLVRLSADPESQTPREGVTDLPMTCFSGGTLEIFVEPQHPRPRLLIVGDLPVARSLAQLGAAMNYHVVSVGLDEGAEALPAAAEHLATLEEAAAALRPFTYVVVATHGNYDEFALERLLPARPTYVGLVASPARARAVRDYLRRQGLTETELLPLKAPAGLDIQARRGDEIALSIMAEIVQLRRSAELSRRALFGELEADDVDGSDAEEAPPATAVDPVCHMDVSIATAKYRTSHEGATYYFCCAGCQTTFESDPTAYIVAPDTQSS